MMPTPTAQSPAKKLLLLLVLLVVLLQLVVVVVMVALQRVVVVVLVRRGLERRRQPCAHIGHRSQARAAAACPASGSQQQRCRGVSAVQWSVL